MRLTQAKCPEWQNSGHAIQQLKATQSHTDTVVHKHLTIILESAAQAGSEGVIRGLDTFMEEEMGIDYDS